MKITTILKASAVSFVSMILFSCGGEESSTTDNLLHKWKFEDNTNKHYIFEPNNNFRYERPSTSLGQSIEASGTYTRNGSSLTISYNLLESTTPAYPVVIATKTFEIIRNTSTRLELKQLSAHWDYHENSIYDDVTENDVIFINLNKVN